LAVRVISMHSEKLNLLSVYLKVIIHNEKKITKKYLMDQHRTEISQINLGTRS